MEVSKLWLKTRNLKFTFQKFQTQAVARINRELKYRKIESLKKEKKLRVGMKQKIERQMWSQITAKQGKT